jgi:signal transduction histidine kinase
MKPDLRFLLPNRISGQMVIIITLSLVSVHLILTAFFLLRAFEREGTPPSHPGQIEAMVALLDAAAPVEREKMAQTFAQKFPDIALRLDRSVAVDWNQPETPGARNFSRHLGPGFRVADLPRVAPQNRHVIAVRLRDGDIVTAQFPRPPGWRFFDPIMVTLLSVAIIVTGLGIWAARMVTAPLRSFAKEAESFSPDGAINLLPERGPVEIRAAARALNQMRERIKSLMDDRTRTLAAVGHDLRTPITRLRLSSEFVADPVLRGQMLRDLDQMKAMVDSILVYLREGRSQKKAVRVDVAACVQTVCDAFADCGSDVKFVAADGGAVLADPEELLRAVTNVVDNAVRYAGGARVSVGRTPASVIISVEDDGPGIPDDRKAAMLQPFVRGDAARNMDEDSGFGLGLSIVRVFTTAYGGSLTLSDRQPHGLVVRIDLPLATVEGQPIRQDSAA